MESFFQEIGFSWTMSKVLPFVLLLLVGVLLFLFVRSKLTKKLFRVLSGLIIFIPPLIYFALNPIYNGDFSNEFNLVKSSAELDLVDADKLVVVAIPYCPFCKESIGKMKLVTERTGTTIEFKVLTSDSSDLEMYEELSNDKINIVSELRHDEFRTLVGGRFPTFLYKKDGEMRVWRNDGFGTVGLDWVEDQLSQK